MFAPRCSHWLDLDPLIASRTLGHSWTIAASHQNQGKTLFPKKVANRLERQHVLCTCCTGTNNALPPPWKNPQQWQSATGWCERLQSISMLQCSNPSKLQYSSGIITSKKIKTYQILLTYWEYLRMLYYAVHCGWIAACQVGNPFSTHSEWWVCAWEMTCTNPMCRRQTTAMGARISNPFGSETLSDLRCNDVQPSAIKCYLAATYLATFTTFTTFTTLTTSPWLCCLLLSLPFAKAFSAISS